MEKTEAASGASGFSTGGSSTKGAGAPGVASHAYGSVALAVVVLEVAEAVEGPDSALSEATSSDAAGSGASEVLTGAESPKYADS